jgi:hypothetical protein
LRHNEVPTKAALERERVELKTKLAKISMLSSAPTRAMMTHHELVALLQDINGLSQCTASEADLTRAG